MAPTPTGRLVRTPEGCDLVLTRTFSAPAEDVWASVTEPERTARWIGPWEGRAAVGATIRFRMSFEEEAGWSDVRIDACTPPRHLAVTALDEQAPVVLELHVAQKGDATELSLVQHLPSTESVGDMGPGWEYYLDMLAASREGTPLPAFDDYYPAQKPYFESL